MKWLKIGVFFLHCTVTIFVINNAKTINCLVAEILFLPICSWLIILVHELSHWLCFRLLGFRVKELRIGLFVFILDKTSKKFVVAESGFFRGLCVADITRGSSHKKMIFSLMAGGISGLLISAMSFIVLISKILPEQWSGVCISFICVGLYSFYATLLNKKSADRNLIKKLIIEEMENDAGY